MEKFGDYSRYYNLLYRDKDYAGEADFIEKLVKENAPNASTILDLGCGTGRHADLLSEKGYIVHGIDSSDEMLNIALKRKRKDKMSFSKGDVRSISLNKKFDVIISLFHVMSYQTSNSDLLNAFTTAYEHLEEGGIFVFDCWYGPAVLTDRPTVRIKRLEDERHEIVRIAEPVLHEKNNIVDVNYQIIIRDKLSHKTAVIEETHPMRYLFFPEVSAMLSGLNLDILSCEEWMTRKATSFKSWNVVFICRK